MRLIPVIDLRGGRAVGAVAGDRARYRPVCSPLCPDGCATTLLANLMGLHAFRCVYVADLDAIERTGHNRQVVEALLRARPDLRLWLDAGFSDVSDLAPWGRRPTFRPVLGSESQGSVGDFRRLLEHAAELRPVLSLDFRAGRPLGPQGIFERPEAWPRDVIVMDLDRVGGNAGPAPHPALRASPRRYYAAGGVRNADDLRALAAAGFSGALVASALHAGRLDARALASLSGLGLHPGEGNKREEPASPA